MGIDFDGLVNKTVVNTFGEGSNSGPVRYTTRGGQSFDLDGLFDQAWQNVAPPSGRHGVPVSTTAPCFGCRLADFPAGVEPQQGDSFVRKNGDAFTVADIQPDGFGWVYLILN